MKRLENSETSRPLGRREFLGSTIAGAGALGLPRWSFAARSNMRDGRSNVLHIITDQQCAFAMSCTGNTWIKTPNLDALAARGMRFERAYTAEPVCVANRKSMLTGLMPRQAGKKDENGKPRAWTVEELKTQSIGWRMREGGYDCGYAGKWHPGKDLLKFGDHGYEELPVCGYGGTAKIVNPNSIEYLNRKRDKPFYLTASYIQPHGTCFWGLSELGNKPWPEGQDPWEFGGDGSDFPDPPDDFEKFWKETCPPLPANFAATDVELDLLQERRKRYFMGSGFNCQGKGNKTKAWSDEQFWRCYIWNYYP